MKKQGVICAIDVTDFDQEVVDLAASFANQFGVELDLVHVSMVLDPSQAAWPAYVGMPNQIIHDNRLLKKIKTNIQGVVIHHHHLSGTPTEKILGFVERNEPRLLILGTHARRGLQRLMGSVASKVMRKAQCPVMVYRQRSKSPTDALKEQTAS